jgi:cellulose synthase/poly-beta-1,6-N-acetylglucosamine synthase-like glycosyltransferase
MSIAEEILWAFSIAILVFFVIQAIVSFTLIAIGLVEIVLTRIERGDSFTPPPRVRRPGVCVLAPAYNMRPLIVASVRSLLASDYEPLEVVIVDDGSSDGTADALVSTFDMIEIPVGDRFEIATAPITHIYVSRIDPRLRVVRKENGGRSDAINAGLNVAYSELVATIDGDTLLDRDALQRIGETFALDPDRIVAVGVNIRVAKGSRIEDNVVVEARVPANGVETTQVAEYLRGFLGGRIAWSRLNALLIISGAFGVFRREILQSLGGLSKETMGEDMEIVMRMHHLLRPGNLRSRIAYAADANAWTEIPKNLGALRHQRIRWHVGLIDNLRLHHAMILRRRFGTVGLFALPYALAFEVVGPLLQVAGYTVLVILLLVYHAASLYLIVFFVLVLLVGQLQTAGARLIEGIAFNRYRVRDLMLLEVWSLVEIFWFRPLTASWRVWAAFQALTGRRPGWGTIPRGLAYGEAQTPDLVSAPLSR